MTHPNHEPRWLRLAARSRAEADPAMLTRLRARLAARASEPAWVRWLARPAALAASAALLVVSAVAGGLLLAQDRTPALSSEDNVALGVGDLLGEDGSYGLTFDASDPGTPTDSQQVSR